MSTVRSSNRLLAVLGGLPGGVCPGGVYRGEGVSVPLCEQNVWQTGLKTLPCRNYIAYCKKDGRRSRLHGFYVFRPPQPGRWIRYRLFTHEAQQCYIIIDWENRPGTLLIPIRLRQKVVQWWIQDVLTRRGPSTTNVGGGCKLINLAIPP